MSRRGIRFIYKAGTVVIKTDLVEFCLGFIEIAEGPEEDGATDPGGDGECAKEVTESLLNVEFDESKVEGRGDGGLELREGDDDGLHALRCLGEGVF